MKENNMTEEERQTHLKLAKQAFNTTWDWMEKTERTQEQNDTMLHTAHASRYHWEFVGNAQNLSIGEWQISRVYALLKRPEPARYHAQRALDHCEANNIKGFALAYAWEAIARAESIAGNREEARSALEKAEKIGTTIEHEETRTRLKSDLATIL
jgi:tetratricopeptide (TPR) repeat protein